MNRHVNAIAGRLSLRSRQCRSLEMLDRITEIAPPRKGADAAAVEAALAEKCSEFPSVTDFEREFASLCFAPAKNNAAAKWCRNASDHAASYGEKPWRYVLIAHDAIADNMSLEILAARYGDK